MPPLIKTIFLGPFSHEESEKNIKKIKNSVDKIVNAALSKTDFFAIWMPSPYLANFYIKALSNRKN